MVGKPVVVTAPVEISPPKWGWGPIIEIGVCPRGWVISHDGRSVTLIVFLFGNLKNRGFLIFGNLRRSSGGA
jgi:hypothetical protein